MLHAVDRGGCTVYNGTSLAQNGILIDCLSPRQNEWRIYDWYDDGTDPLPSPAVSARSFPHPPRVWDRDTLLVVSAFSASAPGTVRMRVNHTPRFLDAARAIGG